MYQQLTNDCQTMDGWAIRPELWNNISGSDCHELEGYTVNLHTDNYENDLQAPQDSRFDIGGLSPMMVLFPWGR
jgi:hypothetical protein